MNFLEQLDECWREIIDISGPEIKKRKFNEFMDRVESQAASLPEAEQVAALHLIGKQMAIYGSLQQNDPEELKVRLGLSAPSASATTVRLGQAAAEPVDVMPQVDEFWREILGRDKKFIETKHLAFIKKVQDQVAHLPKAEQDALLWQVYMRNEEYAKLAQLDRAALKARLGLQSSSATNQLNSSPYTDHLVHVAVDTAVRATVWQGIRAIFRAFR